MEPMPVAEVNITSLKAHSVDYTLYGFTQTTSFTVYDCFGGTAVVNLPGGRSISGTVKRLIIDMVDTQEQLGADEPSVVVRESE